MTVLFMYLFIYWMLVIYLIFIYLSYFCTNVNSFAHISVIFPFFLCLTDPKNKNKKQKTNTVALPELIALIMTFV